MAEQFEHRLVGKVVIPAGEPRVAGGVEPGPDPPVELICRHADVGRREQFCQGLRTRLPDRSHITSECRCESGVVAPFRVLGCHPLEFVEEEGSLKRNRILRPERAVVVEDGDPFRHGHEVG